MTKQDADQARVIYREHEAVDLDGVPTCLVCPGSAPWPCPALWGPLATLLADPTFVYD